MISVIITAWKEPVHVAKSLSIILPQLGKKDEIIVIAPDKETLDAVKKVALKDKRVKMARDKQIGKPAAMNIAAKKAKGDILVWTDGDISISKDAIKNLIKPFEQKALEQKKIGAVTGRPVSIDKINNKFGFWAYMLSNIAHEQRLEQSKNRKRMFCSGYLFAIKRVLMPNLPEELLSEDGYISHLVYKNGYKIEYAPEAIAYISYPKNFSDWIKQKRRSVGGYNQNYKILKVKIRSFSGESKNFWQLFRYIRTPKELLWLIELFAARLYLWAVIYWDINIKNKNREELWVRIESTK